MIKPKTKRPTVPQLQARIKVLQNAIHSIQNSCKHPLKHREITLDSNYGYKDPLECLHEWENHKCGVCLKTWHGPERYRVHGEWREYNGQAIS